MSCISSYRPPKLPTIEVRVEEIIFKANHLLNLDLLPYKERMLIGNPDKLSFTYFGPGIFEFTSSSVQGKELVLPTLGREKLNKYNCVLEYQYWEYRPQQLYFLTAKVMK